MRSNHPLIAAVQHLAAAVVELSENQARASTALADIAREQRITNLIVRAQISTNPNEKTRLLNEAVTRMDDSARSRPGERRR